MPANANFLRMVLVGLWKWAGIHEVLSLEQSLLPKRIPVLPLPLKEIRVASNAEVLAVLEEIKVEFRMLAVLGLFAGMRPEEISPASRSKKPGLDYGAISHDDGVIYVPAPGRSAAMKKVVSASLADWGKSWMRDFRERNRGLMTGSVTPMEPIETPSSATSRK